ncbi:UNVERIFIED_CONTAM: hypothetical protein ACS92_01315 [Bacillus cereus]
MQRHVPLAVGPLEGGNGCIAVEENLGEDVDDRPGGGLGADREAGAVGGRSLHDLSVDFNVGTFCYNTSV